MPSTTRTRRRCAGASRRTVGAGLLVVAGLAFLLPDWVWGPAPVLLVGGMVVYLLLRVLRERRRRPTPAASRPRSRSASRCSRWPSAGFVAAAAGTALGGGIAVAGLSSPAASAWSAARSAAAPAGWSLPALVLALPLGAVAATDLDIRGTWGDRQFRARHRRRARRRLRDGRGADDGRPARRRAAARPDRPARSRSAWARSRCSCRDDMCVTTDADVAVGAIEPGRRAGRRRPRRRRPAPRSRPARPSCTSSRTWASASCGSATTSRARPRFALAWRRRRRRARTVPPAGSA